MLGWMPVLYAYYNLKISRKCTFCMIINFDEGQNDGSETLGSIYENFYQMVCGCDY